MGGAAYEAWASQRQRDGDSPAEERLLRQRHDVHNNEVGFRAEARWHGSRFMVEMTVCDDDLVHRSAIEDLYAASADRIERVVKGWF